MIVSELITKLQKCDQDLKVLAVTDGDDLINDSMNVSGIAQVTMTEQDDCVVIKYE